MSTGSQVTDMVPAAHDWKDLLKDLLPPQGCWTEEAYLVLTDHRIRLVEFTDGFLEALPMPTDKHQSVLQFLLFAFLRFVESRGGTVQFAPLRLRIRTGKYREPDLLLLLSATDSPGKINSGSAPIWLWKSSAPGKAGARPGRQEGRLRRRASPGILDRQPANRNCHRPSIAR